VGAFTPRVTVVIPITPRSTPARFPLWPLSATPARPQTIVAISIKRYGTSPPQPRGLARSDKV
jgi:hypothetical protein